MSESKMKRLKELSALFEEGVAKHENIAELSALLREINVSDFSFS
jgi:hypothetical protein